MKVGTFFLILRDVTVQLTNMGLLSAQGDFVSPNVAQEMELADFVVRLLEKYGVDVPDEIEKVVAALPIIIKVIKS